MNHLGRVRAAWGNVWRGADVPAARTRSHFVLSKTKQPGDRPAMRTVTCIDDLREAARRRVPRAFFDYADGGSYAEQTLNANCADLERIKLRQRILVDVSRRSTQTTMLGEPVSLPLALAPIRALGMQHGDGEVLACRAAQAAGIPFNLSTMSIS